MSTQSLRVTTLAALTLLCISGAAVANDREFRVRPPVTTVDPGFDLPRFGMLSYNTGFGERIVSVRYGGLASQLGLERGDTIVRMNGLRLNYEGAWDDALRRAMNRGGHVVLKIRDTRTGGYVFRHTDIDPYGTGPNITPKYRNVAPRVVNRNARLRYND